MDETFATKKGPNCLTMPQLGGKQYRPQGPGCRDRRGFLESGRMEMQVVEGERQVCVLTFQAQAFYVS